MNRRSWLAATSATLLLALAACASAPKPATVADATASRPDLSTLTRLVNEAGMADTLRGPGPYTVFAPSDEAFKAVPEKTMAQLSSDKAYLKTVLEYHVVASRLSAESLPTGPAKTLQGANVALSRSGTFVTVEDAVVTQADVDATNGVVHVIDRVLIPPAR
jgi:uncharacterized surface protein with fasciclin (FAS1) repeats